MISRLAGRDLKYSIVPDRVAQKHVRTEWTERIAALMEGGLLSFHDHPFKAVRQHRNDPAKLWLAHGTQALFSCGFLELHRARLRELSDTQHRSRDSAR